jgi:hypothetical protein
VCRFKYGDGEGNEYLVRKREPLSLSRRGSMGGTGPDAFPQRTSIPSGASEFSD